MHSDFSERDLSVDFKQVFEIYLLEKTIGKVTKKLRQTQKFRYLANVMTKMIVVTSKLLEVISIALELNKQNRTLLFDV